MVAALVYTWTRPIPGRAALAKALADDIETFWAQHAAAGRTSPPKWYANGQWSMPQMWIVEGEFQTLAGISMTPEFQELNLRAVTTLEEPQWALHLTGDSHAVLWAGYWALMDQIEGA